EAEAVRQSAEADAQRNEAETQRALADGNRLQAELRAAHGLVLEGNALLLAKRWPEAVSRYERASAEYGRLGESDEPARWGLLDALHENVPPLLHIPLVPEGGARVAFSRDGRLLLCAHARGRPPALWEARSGRLVRTFEGDFDGGDVAFSPDGSRVYLIAKGDAVEVEAATGRVLKTFPKPGPDRGVISLALSPDGTRLVLGHTRTRAQGVLALWDVASGTPAWSVDYPRAVVSVAFSPDGKRALSGCQDNFVRLLDPATGATERVYSRLPGYALNVAFLGGGDRVAGTAGGLLRVWTAGGALAREIPCPGGLIQSLDVSPDGRVALVGQETGVARLWNLDTGAEVRALQGHDLGVEGARFAPGGRLAATCANDGIRVWNVAIGAETGILRGHVLPVKALDVSADGRTALTAGEEGTLRLWDVEGGVCMKAYRFPGAPNWGVALLGDGRRAAAAGQDGAVRIFDLDEGSLVRTLGPHASMSMSLDVSPDGKRLLEGDQAGFLRVWDPDTGAELRRIRAFTPEKRPCWIGGVRFLPDGRRAVAASADFTARVFDLEAGRELAVHLGHASLVVAVAFSPDLRWAVSSGFEPRIRVWDLATGALRFALEGHRVGVGQAEFTPDGRRLISVSGDCTMKVWDAESGGELHTLRGGEPFGRFAFLPGGDRLIGARDAALAVWDFRLPERLRETAKARKAAVDRLAADPADAGALRALGEACWRQGAWAWAIEALREARAKGAEVDGLMLARALWREGRLEEAREELGAERGKADPSDSGRAALAERGWKCLESAIADRRETAELLAAAAAAGEGPNRGVLDGNSRLLSGRRIAAYRFGGLTGETVRVEMRSAAFTPVFVLVPPDAEGIWWGPEPAADPGVAVRDWRLPFHGDYLVLCTATKED
ncbi:MAG: hypothetical protein MUC63_09620, partial [Planctomycetes bacterium]|nr:hypothetical protein [Planctomycetota bacterium]